MPITRSVRGDGCSSLTSPPWRRRLRYFADQDANACAIDVVDVDRGPPRFSDWPFVNEAIHGRCLKVTISLVEHQTGPRNSENGYCLRRDVRQSLAT